MSFLSTKEDPRVTIKTLEDLVRDYPFKDLTDLSGYEPAACELELAVRYKAYLGLLRRFVAEKESNCRLFGVMRKADQQKEVDHPCAGSDEEALRRFRYAGSAAVLRILYPVLSTAAEELLHSVAKKRDEHYAALSEDRRHLHEYNHTCATKLLAFLLEIQEWFTITKSRPEQLNTLRGCSLLLNSAFTLLTNPEWLRMREWCLPFAKRPEVKKD